MFTARLLFFSEQQANKYAFTQESNELNTKMHDIELAVERGRTAEPRDHSQGSVPMSGVEVLLKRVALVCSNKGGSGGILKEIKDFNGFLERAAFALESRRT